MLRDRPSRPVVAQQAGRMRAGPAAEAACG